MLQVLPEGDIARIPSSNNSASPIPASLIVCVQKYYLSVSGTRDRDLDAFCLYFWCPQLMALICILTEHPHGLVPFQAKPGLELKNPPPSAALKAL